MLADVKREAIITGFLAHTDWQSATREALNQDASFRRYWRLSLGGNTVMLMDAPPPEKPVKIFADIANFLRQHGLYAPEIVALDEKHGLMLIEDFGDDTFTQILNKHPDQETALYDLAIDTLVQLHQIETFSSLSLATYDHSALNAELLLFIDWFFPAISGTPATTTQKEDYISAWENAFAHCATQQPVLVLRDYHVDNLMRIEHPGKTAQCGLLDFQDALLGPAAYDLISLLEDARRDISAKLKSHCLDRYFSAIKTNNSSRARTEMFPTLNILGAQRHAKVLGIFVRLHKRDNKPIYLKHLPRVLSLYQAALEREPMLSPVVEWTAKNLPFELMSRKIAIGD